MASLTQFMGGDLRQQYLTPETPRQHVDPCTPKTDYEDESDDDDAFVSDDDDTAAVSQLHDSGEEEEEEEEDESESSDESSDDEVAPPQKRQRTGKSLTDISSFIRRPHESEAWRRACPLCTYGSDLTSDANLSRAMEELYRIQNDYVHGALDDDINEQMAAHWNEKIYETQRRLGKRDVPQLTAEDVYRHREWCRQPDADRILYKAFLGVTGFMFDVLDRDTTRVSDDFVSDGVITKDGFKAIKDAGIISCRLLQQLRGSVPSTDPGRNALRKKYAASERERRAEQHEKSKSGGAALHPVAGGGKLAYARAANTPL